MYPQAVVDYVSRYGEHIKKGAVVTDVSGIKRAICPQMTKLSENSALFCRQSSDGRQGNKRF